MVCLVFRFDLVVCVLELWYGYLRFDLIGMLGLLGDCLALLVVDLSVAVVYFLCCSVHVILLFLLRALLWLWRLWVRGWLVGM